MTENRQLPGNEMIGDGPNALRIMLQDIPTGPGGDGPGGNGDIAEDVINNFQQIPSAESIEVGEASQRDIIQLLRHMYPFRLLCVLIRRNPQRLQLFMEHLDVVNPQFSAQIRTNIEAVQDLINEFSHMNQHQLGDEEVENQEAELPLNLQNEIDIFVNNMGFGSGSPPHLLPEAREATTEQYVFWLIREIALSLAYVNGRLTNAAGLDYGSAQRLYEVNSPLTYGEDIDADNELQTVDEADNASNVLWNLSEHDNAVVIGSDVAETISTAYCDSNDINNEELENQFIATCVRNEHNYAAVGRSTTNASGQNASNDAAMNDTSINTPQTKEGAANVAQVCCEINGRGMSSLTTAPSEVSAGVQHFTSFASYDIDENNYKSKSNAAEPFEPNYSATLPNLDDMDKASIQRLSDMGFPEDMVVQAYYACQRNEAKAANFLMSYL